VGILEADHAMLFGHLRVLVIEDCDRVRERIVAALRQVAIDQVTDLATAEDALRLLPEIEPDVVLVGNVTAADGSAGLIEAIRCRLSSHRPIIFVSDYGSLWRSSEVKQAGATEILVAPFTTRSLIQKLHRAVASREPATRRDRGGARSLFQKVM
jgi:DNA-binding NtrC family response regulator